MTLADEKKLSDLDIRLLKGFYTSSRTELERIETLKQIRGNDDSVITETVQSVISEQALDVVNEPSPKV